MIVQPGRIDSTADPPRTPLTNGEDKDVSALSLKDLIWNLTGLETVLEEIIAEAETPGPAKIKAEGLGQGLATATTGDEIVYQT